MNAHPALRVFSDLPLRRKFILMLAVLATGIIALCLVTARRNHDELLRNERNALHTRVEAALALASHRVVVKRPRNAPVVTGRPPSHALEGKSSRYDIYALKALSRAED